MWESVRHYACGDGWFTLGARESQLTYTREDSKRAVLAVRAEVTGPQARTRDV